MKDMPEFCYIPLSVTVTTAKEAMFKYFKTLLIKCVKKLGFY